MNENISEEEKFDMIILDEAQDLITPYYLEVIDLVLKGGVKNGRFICFGDFSNQAIFLNQPEEVIQTLTERTNFTRFPPLKINCRNTKRIASQNTLLTGIIKPEFTSRSIVGEIIINKFPSSNSERKVIEEIIEELIDKGIPLKNITLLSSKRIENNVLHDSEYVHGLKRDGLIVTTIQSYKGLENSIVVLYDFDEITSEDSQRLLYIGISRAKQVLYMVLNNSLKKSFDNLIANNFNK